MGFFVPEETAIVWRGPMVHTAIQQFFRDVLWGELDYLLVDLPPGTGDAQLSLSQIVPLTGVVTVTTPQEVALYDVRKGLMMFKKVNVPLLGVIENMSFFVCGHCGERTEIFSFGGRRARGAEIRHSLPGSHSLGPGDPRGWRRGHAHRRVGPGFSPSPWRFKGAVEALQTRVQQLTKETTGATLSDMVKKLKEPME